MLPLCTSLWGWMVVLQVSILFVLRVAFLCYFPFSCFESNLNGEYFEVGEDNGYYRGIVWELWLGDYSLKSAVMMVRPRELPPPAPSLPTVPAPDP